VWSSPKSIVRGVSENEQGEENITRIPPWDLGPVRVTSE